MFTSWDYHSVRGDKPDQRTHKNDNRSGNSHPERTIPYQFQELSPAIPEPSQTLMEACAKRRQALMDSLGGVLPSSLLPNMLAGRLVHIMNTGREVIFIT